MKRSLLAVLCLALSALCISSQLAAAPHYGDPWKFKQPDGTLVDVRVWGDEYYQVVESPDGYTLIRDEATQWIVYADLSADGNSLVPTNVRYGSGSAALAGVMPHIRINSKAARAQAALMRAQAFPETPTMYAGGEPKMVPPKVGNVVGLVLLADFSDINGTIAVSEVNNYCNQAGYNNNGNNGSVSDYFDDVSNGLLNYTMDVSDDYFEGTGGSFAAYYDDCTQPWLARAKELIEEILDDMEANGTDFSVYDSNGDGEIDAINLFFAGGGTACGWAKGMWPGSGSMGGSWSADGVSANRYQITHMGNTLTIGTFCHENGHMVCGWPDLYDYDTGVDDSAGVGGFDIMCNGMSDTNPVEPSAELKRSAGWLTPTDLPGSPTTGLSLANASGNTCYRFAKSGTEYYLLENRQKTGRDAELPDAGLALWHIDTAKWIPGNGNDEQQRTNALHYYVTLVQADGDWDLEGNMNQGDTDDLYSSPNDRAATPCTNPNTDWWDGTESGLSITNISGNSNSMTFDFSDEDNDPVAQVQNHSEDADTDCCINVTVAEINNGSYDPDGPGDIASMVITHVDGVGVGNQTNVDVCGDGLHTVRLTVTDLCGNTDTADASVEVINSPPVALAQDFEANADDNCCIVVHLSDIDAGSYDPDGDGDIKSFCITDLDGSAVSCADSVTVCGQGWHTVDITITDWCDSTSTATANVEVIDITPPSIEVILDRNALWPPNHKMVEVCVDSMTVTDNCDPDPDVALHDAWSDEPDNSKADGNTTGDIDGADLGTEDTCFSLRSERQGTEDGRTYTIVYSATDNSGNVGYDTVTVDCPHDQSASAFSSSGFIADGSALKTNATTFALFIPGGDDLEVRRINTTHLYVGNTAGVVRAYDTRLVEINNDGFTDMAVMFHTDHGVNMEAIDGLQSVTTIDDGVDATVISDGPIGLHFTMIDGKDYLVGNVYGLGTPIPMPDIAGKRTVTPEQETVAPITTPVVTKGTTLTSVSPNPFNPQTTVHFTLASASKVRIAIYDVKGSLVRRLVDESMPAGDHQALWNGRDDAGNGATSGIYFVRMIAGSYTEVRKIVMLK